MQQWHNAVQCTVLHATVAQCSTVHCTACNSGTIQYSALYCMQQWHNTVQCTVLHATVAQYSTVHCIACNSGTIQTFPFGVNTITDLKSVTATSVNTGTLLSQSGPGSSVGIAIGYELDDPGIESRWGARFFAPVQTDPGAHPVYCTMGTGSFPGGKVRPGRDADPSPPSSAVGHERVELYLYSPLWAVRSVQSLSACTRATFTFTFFS